MNPGAEMFKRLCLALLFAATLPAQAADYTDIWYTPPENGWGVNFVQSDNFIFATFFIYGPDSKPTWYTGQMNADGLGHYTGGLYATTGTYFGTVPFNPAQTAINQVGTLTFTPSAADAGMLTYNVGAVTVTKNIQRLTLTGIALGGNYTGGQSGAYSACTSAGDNFLYKDNFDASVMQTDTGATFTFNYTSGINCTLSGNLVQSGQLYSIPSATYVCDTGLSTTASMSEIKKTSQGIEGVLSAPSVGLGCREDATFSAVTF
jgi:hypothetical protein